MTPRARPGAVRVILVPVDGSPSSRRAVELAATMAVAFEASLTLLHVASVGDLPVLMAEVESTRESEEGQVILSEEVRLARAAGADPKVVLRRGRAIGQILRVAASLHPDLIVMGTRGLSRARGILLGSVSGAVSRRAKVQVVLVR